MVNTGYSDPAKYLPALKSITYKGGERSQIAVVR
jgi:hypothetical protein